MNNSILSRLKNRENYTRIFFKLEPDEHGWPPVGAESMWAVKVGENEYKIDNIPFYVRGISVGDIVSTKEEDKVLYYNKLLKDSGNCTIRVFIQNENVKETEGFLRTFLKEKGAEIEGLNEGFFAIDISPSVDLEIIMDHLREGEKRGEWAFEEGKIRK